MRHLKRKVKKIKNDIHKNNSLPNIEQTTCESKHLEFDFEAVSVELILILQTKIVFYVSNIMLTFSETDVSVSLQLKVL